MIILAVPGGCIQEPAVLGRLEIYNRSTDTLIIAAEQAEGDPFRIDPCGEAVFNDFPLNSVNIAAEERTDSLGFQWGVDQGPLIILVTAEEPESLSATPADLPECRGHLP
jgi:hypothetical protein